VSKIERGLVKEAISENPLQRPDVRDIGGIAQRYDIADGFRGAERDEYRHADTQLSHKLGRDGIVEWIA
jgi:hypothetical protein